MQQPHYNIAHILPWLTVGGVECATLRIAQGVEGEEFTSVAFLLPEADAVKRIFTAEGFETLTYQGIEPSYRHPKHFFRASLALAKELKRKNINLVHCSDLSAAYYATFAGKLARIPVLCHIRGCYPELSRRDQSFLYPVNRFAFVSLDTWKRFAYKVPAHHGTLVYDGIEVKEESALEPRESVRYEYNIPENAKIIGMVARIAEAKDYTTLARAAARIVAVDKNVRFLIVGDYSGTTLYQEHYEEVKRMLAANGVTEYFIFTDFQTDVTRFLNAMDIFVLSTHDEGLPLVILEAMAQGKPVLATRVGGIPEIVIDEKTGLLHQHQNDEQLSAHVLALLQNENLAICFGEAGRQVVKTNWSPERFTQDIKNLYRQMVVGEFDSFDKRFVESSQSKFKEKKL